MAEKSVAKKSTAKSQKKASGVKAGKTATTRKSPAKAVKKIPSHEEISSKAHEIYLERIAKGEPGNPESDWQQALKSLQNSK